MQIVTNIEHLHEMLKSNLWKKKKKKEKKKN